MKPEISHDHSGGAFLPAKSTQQKAPGAFASGAAVVVALWRFVRLAFSDTRGAEVALRVRGVSARRPARLSSAWSRLSSTAGWSGQSCRKQSPRSAHRAGTCPGRGVTPRRGVIRGRSLDDLHSSELACSTTSRAPQVFCAAHKADPARAVAAMQAESVPSDIGGGLIRGRDYFGGAGEAEFHFGLFSRAELPFDAHMFGQYVRECKTYFGHSVRFMTRADCPPNRPS